MHYLSIEYEYGALGLARDQFIPIDKKNFMFKW